MTSLFFEYSRDMLDWKEVMDSAMQLEGDDTIGAHQKYGEAVRTALQQVQIVLDNNEISALAMETLYGALVAYSQQVILRLKAEDPDVGSVDHAFRVGQAYGVSCVLNHLVDKLTDKSESTALAALDAFSDSIHNEILIGAEAAGLTVELLDAKGEILDN